MILYELLTGRTPIDSDTLREATHAQLQRLIFEMEPMRPSARVLRPTQQQGSTTGSSSELRKLAAVLRGELDWIVMKAIEKDRARRYETASALASDIRSYLKREPVQAAPPSALYRLRKSIARNRALVAATAAVLAALSIGLTGFAWQAKLANARADELAQVSQFQARMLNQVDPTRAGLLLSDDVQAQYAAALAHSPGSVSEHETQRDAFARQWRLINTTDAARNLIDSTILKPAARAIDAQFQDQPLVAATLRQVLASLYYTLGLYDASLPLQKSALDIRSRVLGPEHLETMASMNSMGVLLADRGDLVEAEELDRRVLALRRRVMGPDHRDTLESINNLALVLKNLGQYEESEALFRESLAGQRRTRDADDANTLSTMSNLGDLLMARGQLDEAEALFREALAAPRQISDEDHPDYLIAMNNLGAVLFEQDKLAEAEPYFRESLRKSRTLLGEEHPDTLVSISNLGMLLQDEGKLDEAERLNREALEKMRRVLGEDHPSTLTATTNLGSLLMDERKWDQAEPLLRSALDASRRVSGDDHPNTLYAINNLAVLLRRRGEIEQSERLFREGLERSQRTLGQQHPLTVNFNQKLAQLLTETGRVGEAEPFVRAAQAAAEAPAEN